MDTLKWISKREAVGKSLVTARMGLETQKYLKLLLLTLNLVGLDQGQSFSYKKVGN